MRRYLKIAILFALSALSFVFPSYGTGQHNHNDHAKMYQGHDMGHKRKNHSNTLRRLTKKDIAIFFDTFNPIEKELQKKKASLFNNLETFEVALKNSDKISRILEQKRINSSGYIDVFTRLTAAYNEIKMRNFEARIENNQHERIVPRKGLMLDHNSKEHSMLHDMQAKNFSETFAEDGLLGEGDEPVENIKLVEAYEKELDRLFHTP